VRGSGVHACIVTSFSFLLQVCGICISFALETVAIIQASHSFEHTSICTYWRSTVLTICKVYVNESRSKIPLFQTFRYVSTLRREIEAWALSH
jgi:hypothetical protein